jgi:hypothetical protein
MPFEYLFFVRSKRRASNLAEFIKCFIINEFLKLNQFRNRSLFGLEENKKKCHKIYLENS